MKILLIALASLFLTGCANRLYQWGDYGSFDSKLYQSYRNPEKALEFRQGLELHISKIEASKQKVAPGLYAELGTLHLQAGDANKAVAMYIKERDAWPESRVLMDALINNVTKRASAKTEIKS
ncbi:MAG: hypothetical protein A3E79_04965 [Burkholderiales bacterium RIFCSPHIGHO2_12_FULL_61_11]|nr:MAG: hypothetical protein A3E79_04965 [Burkholderiales bacterium RIFCSPHIGHO2_12_FULL_61_11]